MTTDEADEELAEAIRCHAAAYDLNETGELLGDYAVVAYWVPADTAGDGESRYTTHFSRPNVPTHIAVGLFSTAADLVGEE